LVVHAIPCGTDGASVSWVDVHGSVLVVPVAAGRYDSLPAASTADREIV
jgi:hypothetical protein